MKISVRRGDEGFVADARGIQIFLDDVSVRDVISADEETGTITRFRSDVVSPDGDAFAEESLKGKVRIEYPNLKVAV